jgi:hypothetical protein
MEEREPAKVFEDRLTPGDWRVEWEDEDGGVEVTIFSGPDARQRAIQYAEWRYCQLSSAHGRQPEFASIFPTARSARRVA